MEKQPGTGAKSDAPSLKHPADRYVVGGPVSDAELASLKEQHGDVLHETTIETREGPVRFIWREPRHGDWELFSKGVNNPATPSHQPARNLLRSLVVHPDKAATVNALKNYPLAIGQWLSDEVHPFFGQGAEVTTTKL